MPPQASAVYEHFDEIEDDNKRLSCKYCQTTITKKASNLKKHLHSFHKELYIDYENDRSDQLQPKRKADGELSDQIYKQPKTSKLIGDSTVMKLCVDLVVRSGRPFSLFEDKSMRSLISLAKLQTCEKIEICSGSVKKSVQATARDKRAEIRQLISGKVLSFSLDFVTCRLRSFIGLNAQLFINGAIRGLCLLCRELEQNSALDHRRWIEEGQQEFQIIDSQIIALAIDNARSKTSAYENLPTEEDLSEEDETEQVESYFDDDPVIKIEEVDDEFQSEEDKDDDDETFEHSDGVRMYSVTHILQLAMNDFLQNNKRNSRSITIARKLSAKLRNSSVRDMITDADLNQANLDQKSRWNSTYLMVVRLLNLKDFCQQNASRFHGLNISAKRWKELQELRDILKPVADLSARLQDEKLDVTQFIAFWKIAMIKVEQLKSAKATELRRCIEEREQQIFTNCLIRSAIYLDKRFSFTLRPEETVIAKAFIMQMWRKRKILAEEMINKVEETSAQINTEDDMYQLDAFLSNLARNSLLSSQSAATQMSPTVIEAELSDYDSFPRLTADTQITDFWKTQKQFPVLKEIALDIISVPLTEVSVQRLFSHVDFILNPCRSNANVDLIEDILFLRMNETFENAK